VFWRGDALIEAQPALTPEPDVVVELNARKIPRHSSQLALLCGEDSS
jgi:hypothetical protein